MSSMNISDEAEKRYPALQRDNNELTYPRSALREFRRSSFIEGAEWARKEAVAEYIRTKEMPKVRIEFTNQPAFDTFTRETKAAARKEALREAIELLRGEGEPGHPGEFISVNHAQDALRALAEGDN